MTVRPIVVLSDSLIDLIAAGEVVERPASVLKELIENSLDASASRITVDIQGGGTRLVQVADNGEGLSEQNALLAIERHATSKLTRAEDLEEILTMGFRGEALPSIAAVGKFVMESWDGSSTSGTRVVIRNGRLSKVEPCARSRGTTASLERIFQNIPARRKFLKSRGT
ncbi:MAG TPA: DNA mismatch repair protein MutL, partial [Proteobacteria bacterium]|nr:DNA mismatch repair protein MutL [Pseudomonadota bacterium]